MRILAIEPYYGGSHKAFLDGWIAHSRHQWTVFGLPPYKWKWRMRHSAVTIAEQVRSAIGAGGQWDALFCSDMLNLAEFRGLAPPAARELPTIAYFHENQLTYPVREPRERDYHFAFTNFTTALAADQVWFNSEYHRRGFLSALRELLARMPDHQPLQQVAKIERKSTTRPPGIEPITSRDRPPTPQPRILWAARWEHDKNPETFFQALDCLRAAGVSFRLSVIGEQFGDSPEVFERARKDFAGQIDRWGYQPSREEYLSALREADIVVSTADHEFFGLAMVEASAAGAYPVLPQRLAYPELLATDSGSSSQYFYEGSIDSLVDRLKIVCGRVAAGEPAGSAPIPSEIVARYFWGNLVPEMDRALEMLTD